MTRSPNKFVDYYHRFGVLKNKLINTIQRRPEYIPFSAMLIMAHPDDPEFYCAGTIAHWVKNGTRVKYIIYTNGQLGTEDITLSNDDLACIRKQEQLSAAEVTGVKDVVFLNYMDSELINSPQIRRQLVQEIRSFRPEVVIINDPDDHYGNTYINHPDHRIAASAALDSIFPLACSPLFLRDIDAYKVPKVYIVTWLFPNTWVDISDTIDIKIAALKKYPSQIGNWDPTDDVKKWAAKSSRFTGIKYAETFFVINLNRFYEK